MPADRIEREIRIDAPVDVVWAVVTEPEHIGVWFSDRIEVDIRPGAAGRLLFEQNARTRPTSVNIRVERLEPPTFFAFRWGYPDGTEAEEANAALVEFSLEPHGGATILRLVESGLDAFGEERQTYFDEHNVGWDFHLESLRRHAVALRSPVAG